MGRVFEEIDEKLSSWIESQSMFFVSTAPLSGDGLVNCSPKGLDSFRILGRKQVAYLDLYGSGIETVAHLKENGRIVFMFCAFTGSPRIVRLHGRGVAYELGTDSFEEMLKHFPEHPKPRAIIVADLVRIADSCGYGVPRYRFVDQRSTLLDYTEKRSAEEMSAKRKENNFVSLDGLPGMTR